MLKDSNMEDDEITCTPAFLSSKLAGNVEHANKPKKDNEDLCIVEPFSNNSDSGSLIGMQDEPEPMEEHVSLGQEETAKEKSFAVEFQHLDYPTLWELTDCQRDDFYVPSFSSIITPVKASPQTPTPMDSPTSTPTPDTHTVS